MSENIMKKGSSYFTLVGRAKINNYTFSLDNTSDSGFIYNKANIGVDCGNGNVVYGEMMGGYNPEKNYPIYVHGKKMDGEKVKDDYSNSFTIDWADRNDASVLEDIGENCFIKISLVKDKDDKYVTEKFLSSYDAIAYLNENLQNDMIVRVSGNLEYSIYNDEVQTRKKITSVYAMASDTPAENFKSSFTQSFLLTTDSLSKKKDTEKNCLTVYGYVVDYLGKYDGKEIKQNVAYPKSFDIDLGRYTEEQLKLQIKSFFTGKKNWYSELVVEGELCEGVQTSSMTVDDLPDNMRDLVNMGVITEDEAIAKSVITGTREKRMIWVRPSTTKSVKEDGGVDVRINYTPEKYKMDEVVMYSDVIDNDDTPTNNTEEAPKKEEKKEETTPAPTTEDGVDLSFLFDAN